ncbi:NADPH-dependent FMN reductase [Variibacter gotjawalensis]|uniref:NADPH-dependent FMN reductase n=1 Tax=Variibacter gotjawalensis TaxID=1333996 RepID=A0A0S3Q0T2_9BRAD|nr:NAD(P)H-dependent oxidoreductase [Variibacter gotjawalensis]NIK47598.1 NAD(P)H-dependent FMN reductase [Variibacter gotjawalensis]RZS49495.1 NAD(P)H-dependent FMN reductase [Variibacter gotjawalensis]BAT61758.1 NADPH-dependent FMN reductase [Variibacter gotjawalensis]
MANPKILVFAGSIRNGSFNARLAALAVKELVIADAEVTHISLGDFPLPLYDGNLETLNGPPDNAYKLKRLFCTHEGIFIVSPEYNASVTPLLKNTIDWVSRVREGREVPLAAYKDRVFAIAGASPGPFGAMRSLMALRQVLEVGCGALVIPEMVAVREATNAFDERDNLTDTRAAGALKNAVQRLVDVARSSAIGSGQ